MAGDNSSCVARVSREDLPGWRSPTNCTLQGSPGEEGATNRTIRLNCNLGNIKQHPRTLSDAGTLYRRRGAGCSAERGGMLRTRLKRVMGLDPECHPAAYANPSLWSHLWQVSEADPSARAGVRQRQLTASAQVGSLPAYSVSFSTQSQDPADLAQGDRALLLPFAQDVAHIGGSNGRIWLTLRASI
jgi:hypothetical protein